MKRWLPSEIVQNKARAVGAEQWLERLPDLVAELERAWSITVGKLLHGGTEAFVAEATLDDGSDAVLKLLIPRAGGQTESELQALRLADGEGCVKLFEADPERDAMLLERLGRPMCDLDIPVLRRHELLCDAARRMWRPAPDCGLQTGAEKGHWLMDFIERTWPQLGRPCSQRAVEYALRCAERRIAAHDDERAVLVHGDVHQWNALESDDGFKLVDPDGLLAEPEYDLGILMREDPVELLQGDPRERAERLAARASLDAQAIWEWGVVERVSTGLTAAQIDLQPEGDRMLAAAEAVAEMAA